MKMKILFLFSFVSLPPPPIFRCRCEKIKIFSLANVGKKRAEVRGMITIKAEFSFLFSFFLSHSRNRCAKIIFAKRKDFSVSWIPPTPSLTYIQAWKELDLPDKKGKQKRNLRKKFFFSGMHFYLVPCCTFSLLLPLCGETKTFIPAAHTYTQAFRAQKKKLFLSRVRCLFQTEKRRWILTTYFSPTQKKGIQRGSWEKEEEEEILSVHIWESRLPVNCYAFTPTPSSPKIFITIFFRVLDIDMGNHEQEILFFSALAQKESIWKCNGRRRRPIYFPSLSTPLHCRVTHFNIRRRGGGGEGQRKINNDGSDTCPAFAQK